MLFWIICSSKAQRNFNQFSLFWVRIALNVSIHPCWLAIWWCVCLICRITRGKWECSTQHTACEGWEVTHLRLDVLKVFLVSVQYLLHSSVKPWPLFKAEQLSWAPGTSAGHSAFRAGRVCLLVADVWLDFPLALSCARLYTCCCAFAMDALQQGTLGDVEPCGITGWGGREGKCPTQDLLCSPSQA